MPCAAFHPSTAQQEAQRATFIVEKAEQDRQHKVVQAEGEAQAAYMISSSTVSCELLAGCVVVFLGLCCLACVSRSLHMHVAPPVSQCR